MKDKCPMCRIRLESDDMVAHLVMRHESDVKAGHHIAEGMSTGTAIRASVRITFGSDSPKSSDDN